jgi:hypothetical protein
MSYYHSLIQSGSSNGALTQAFIDAGIISTSPIIIAFNDFETTGTSQGWLSKMNVFHPYMGGTDSVKSSKNFIDINNFNAIFSGGLTFSSSGIKGNGTNGTYTFGRNGSDYTDDACFIGCYVHTLQTTSSATLEVDFGTSSDEILLFSQYSNQTYGRIKSSTYIPAFTPVSFTGAFTLYRNVGSVQNIRHGSSSVQSASNSVNTGTNPISVFNKGTEYYSTRLLGCFYSGNQAISDAESLQINQAIQTLMTVIHP